MRSTARQMKDDERNSATMTSVGTGLWMAPEVARNEAYNFKADIYSFGMMLLELVKRDLPYSRDDRRKGKLMKLCRSLLRSLRSKN